MGKLTTHILDIANGRPAADVSIELYRLAPAPQLLLATRSNRDGRCDGPLLQGDALQQGEYELIFGIADYFRVLGTALADPPFIDKVVIRFGIADAGANYHIPLLASPWSYSTYRGS